MSAAILITARLGSRRLSRKQLLQVNERPLLQYLIDRIRTEFKAEIEKKQVKLAIATSVEPENKEFEQFANEDVSVFYGSPSNVPLRHLQAAHHYTVGAIVSVDGDDILCSTRGMRFVYKAISEGAKCVKTVNLPFGMNSRGYSTHFLECCLSGREADVLETGWDRVFKESDVMIQEFASMVGQSELRFTLDYKEDFDFFKAVILALGERVGVANDEEITSLVISKNLHRINQSLHENYWQEFYGNVDKETARSAKH
jgi:spore coat polysaccharide biosynthesis protein SpsF